jgi:hypothetical protein
MRLSAVCRNLGIAKPLGEQWIARGIVAPEKATVRGSARDLTFADAVRFAIASRLSDGGQPISRIMPAIMLHHIDVTFEDDEALLLIQEGGSLGATKASDDGRRLEPDASADLRGSYAARVVRKRDLVNVDPGPGFDLRLSLDQFRARVRSFWED